MGEVRALAVQINRVVLLTQTPARVGDVGHGALFAVAVLFPRVVARVAIVAHDEPAGKGVSGSFGPISFGASCL